MRTDCVLVGRITEKNVIEMCARWTAAGTRKTWEIGNVGNVGGGSHKEYQT